MQKNVSTVISGFDRIVLCSSKINIRELTPIQNENKTFHLFAGKLPQIFIADSVAFIGAQLLESRCEGAQIFECHRVDLVRSVQIQLKNEVSKLYARSIKILKKCFCIKI